MSPVHCSATLLPKIITTQLGFTDSRALLRSRSLKKEKRAELWGKIRTQTYTRAHLRCHTQSGRTIGQVPGPSRGLWEQARGGREGELDPRAGGQPKAPRLASTVLQCFCNHSSRGESFPALFPRLEVSSNGKVFLGSRRPPANLDCPQLIARLLAMAGALCCCSDIFSHLATTSFLCNS